MPPAGSQLGVDCITFFDAGFSDLVGFPVGFVMGVIPIFVNRGFVADVVLEEVEFNGKR